MTYRFLDPGIRVALDRISNYAETCWTVYDQHTKGKLPLEAAVSRIQICTTRRTAATNCCATSARL